MPNISFARLSYPVALATALSLLLVSAVIAWDGTCDSGQVCIWQDRDFKGADAATGTVIDVYTGHYPGTSVNINDSASAVKNRTTKDVVYYHENYQTGGNLCTDSLNQWGWVGLFSNDAFSSHETTGVDTVC